MKILLYAGLCALLIGIAPIRSLAQNPPAAATDDTQLSFQGANIDAVVQWLAKTTGKSVVKHPKVQCQLTIVSSKKLTQRDALNLVYRALALEGFNVIESTKAVLIVPEGTDPKINPELVENGKTDIPDGRQRLIKIFPLQNVQATDIQSKVKGVLSEKASVEVTAGNQLMVTDYNDNLRVVGELIKELDVASPSETIIEFFTLKYAEAEELGTLLGYILNAQSAPPTPPSSSSSSRSSRSTSISSPFESSSPSPSSSTPSTSSASTPPAQSTQGVKIWPDKVANRLIIAAPKSRMPEVKKLVELLDTEKPQDVAIRVIPLKNVNADDLVRDIQPLYQKLSGRSIKDIIEVGANARANSVIVLASESNFKAIEALVRMLDTEEAQEKIIETFLLKNADAEEVAKQLQDLNSDQGGTGRYPFLFFSYSSMSSRQPVKPTFVADRRRNAVIVQIAPGMLENIRGMINALDEPVTDDSLAPRIFRLKFVSAQDIEDILNELFLKRTQQRMYWDPYGFPSASRDPGDQAAGKLYGKVRITSEPYANAIIVTANSAENLAAVEEVLKQLDQPSQAGESTLRVELRFAKAATVANSLNILFARNGSPPLRGGGTQQPNQPVENRNQNQTGQQQGYRPSDFALEQEAREESYFPWLGGQQDQQRTPDGRSLVRPVSDLVGRIRIVPDHRANGLLVSANSHFFPQILRLIKELDAPTAQVLIEARIVEVSNDFLDKMGVRWSPDGSATFTPDDLDNAILARVRGRYTEDFGGKSTALANSMRAGLLDTTINLDFLIQFLKRTTDATVLAEPQINISDNEVGKLFVGQQVPFINNSQNTAEGTVNQTFSYKDVGVILEVTPHINTDGDVALKIRAESSSIVPGQTLFGGAILDTRNFKTDLTCKNGQTLVLGGIIQKQVSDTLRKTPFFGSIPVFGWLFKKKDNVRREVELMVFLRPRVVRTPEEAQQLLEDVDRKVPLIRGWRENGVAPDPKSPESEVKSKEKRNG